MNVGGTVNEQTMRGKRPWVMRMRVLYLVPDILWRVCIGVRLCEFLASFSSPLSLH